MKIFYYILLFFLSSWQIALAQYADPTVGGAFYNVTESAQGTNISLTFSYANSGSSIIPAGSIEVSVSSASVSYNSDGISNPTETGGASFSWTFVGGDTWKGINTNPIAAYTGGEITFSVTALQVATNYEITNIHIQPINNFSTFYNNPNNDNLQLGLRIDPTTGLALQAKVLLQGSLPFGGTLMYDSLRSLGLIPLTEPYTALSSFAHVGEGGGETVANSVLQQTGNEAIVDWVFVELRSAIDSTQVVTTRSALLQRDGDIADLDGTSILTFNSTAPANYYVAVRHRNHLGAMTASSFALTASPNLVDFTSFDDTQTWGMYAQKDLNGDGSLWSLWSGNSNTDGYEIFQGINNDPNIIFYDVITASNNTNFLANYIYRPIYSNSDVNMDGQVIFQGPDNEPNYIFFNVLSYPPNTAFIKNYIMTQQLP